MLTTAKSPPHNIYKDKPINVKRVEMHNNSSTAIKLKKQIKDFLLVQHVEKEELNSIADALAAKPKALRSLWDSDLIELGRIAILRSKKTQDPDKSEAYIKIFIALGIKCLDKAEPSKKSRKIFFDQILELQKEPNNHRIQSLIVYAKILEDFSRKQREQILPALCSPKNHKRITLSNTQNAKPQTLLLFTEIDNLSQPNALQKAAVSIKTYTLTNLWRSHRGAS